MSNWDHKDSSGRITFYQIEIQCVPLEKLLCMFYFVKSSNFRNVKQILQIQHIFDQEIELFLEGHKSLGEDHF